jgi:hypothetical protein
MFGLFKIREPDFKKVGVQSGYYSTEYIRGDELSDHLKEKENRLELKEVPLSFLSEFTKSPRVYTFILMARVDRLVGREVVFNYYSTDDPDRRTTSFYHSTQTVRWFSSYEFRGPWLDIPNFEFDAKDFIYSMVTALAALLLATSVSILVVVSRNHK